MDKFKEFMSKLSSKTKKLIIAGAVAVVAFAVFAGIALNNKPYGLLFTGISSEEARQIIGKLQDDGVPYEYNDGDIYVPEALVNTTKAKLVSEDYPKSGFTYDVFKDNVSMMTTDADRRAFKLYDLETRIGSTIQLFEGVQEAYVTIALGEEKKYALEDTPSVETSAQAVVVMKDGGSPTQEQAKSVQRLISRSIPGMVIDNVSVFDGNGREISVSTNGEEASGKESEEIAQVIENQISAKIVNVLGAIYGNGNVKVAVKCRVNMEKLIRESTTYNTPEKIDVNDKTGILSDTQENREYSGSGEVASGVAGAESNADIPQYGTQAGQDQNAYGSSSLTKKYLVNQIKEQGQVSPGVLEDLSVSVAINGTGYGPVQLEQLQALIGNAAGIAEADRAAKIAVVPAPFYQIDVPDPKPIEIVDKPPLEKLLPFIIIGAVAFVLLLTLIIVLVVRRKKKKKMAGMVAAAPMMGGKKALQQPEINDDMIDLGDDKTVELRDNIRDFADQNPEISAQLLKAWLNGGDVNGG